MQREVIRLQMNQRVQVRLDTGPAGQERTTEYGLDYQYIVNADRGIMWLPAEGRKALLQSGAQAGDDLYLTKCKRGNGIFFHVQLVQPPVEQRVPRQATGTYGRPRYAACAAPSYPVPPHEPVFEEPRIPEVPAMRPGAEMVAGYLYCAIDAAMAASHYAKERHGLPLQFDTEQVRRLAITLMIGAQHGNSLEEGGKL